MSRYRRSRANGATFFFTVITYQRSPILTEPDMRAALRHAIQEVRRQHPFTAHGWVLLPDHMHCIWELPSGDAAFGKRWGLIKASVGRYCRHRPQLHDRNSSRAKRHEATLWQRRFWEHQIRDEKDFASHMDYIHWNPVKHGYVRRAMDWPYPTFHRYVRSGVYPADWGVAENQCDDGGNYGE